MMNIEELVRTGAERGASDIHFVCGVPVRYRINGVLTDAEDHILTPEDCESYAVSLAKNDYDQMRTIGELDFASTIAGHRIRINLYREQGTTAGALRILSDTIPALGALGLPPIVNQFAAWNKGIVLVTGETGSGKSTTLAAVLDQINHTRKEHIITLEDPIEYIYHPDQSLISQREIGTDTRSYSDGLRAVLREDPDIILIGEMRDTETISTALTAAETGHLVFTTLHTNGAVDSIDRIVSVFAADRQKQVRMQLSTTLKAVLSQQLLPKKDGTGRVCACEAMAVTSAIRNMIREGSTPQMQSALMTSKSEGSITMDNSLISLVKNNSISAETAIAAANDPDYVRKNAGGFNTWNTNHF